LWLDTYTYAVYMPTSFSGLQCTYINIIKIINNINYFLDDSF
jgi:hypothetical protein